MGHTSEVVDCTLMSETDNLEAEMQALIFEISHDGISNERRHKCRLARCVCKALEKPWARIKSYGTGSKSGRTHLLEAKKS